MSDVPAGLILRDQLPPSGRNNSWVPLPPTTSNTPSSKNDLTSAPPGSGLSNAVQVTPSVDSSTEGPESKTRPPLATKASLTT
ncbi:hypothetical protein D3C80_2051290 [compost metagenome]